MWLLPGFYMLIFKRVLKVHFISLLLSDKVDILAFKNFEHTQHIE
jgi:hypothetical protein